MIIVSLREPSRLPIRLRSGQAVVNLKKQSQFQTLAETASKAKGKSSKAKGNLEASLVRWDILTPN